MLCCCASPVSRSSSTWLPEVSSYVTCSLPMLVSACHVPTSPFNRSNAAVAFVTGAEASAANAETVNPATKIHIAMRIFMSSPLEWRSLSSAFNKTTLEPPANRHHGEFFFSRQIRFHSIPFHSPNLAQSPRLGRFRFSPCSLWICGGLGGSETWRQQIRSLLRIIAGDAVTSRATDLLVISLLQGAAAVGFIHGFLLGRFVFGE